MLLRRRDIDESRGKMDLGASLERSRKRDGPVGMMGSLYSMCTIIRGVLRSVKASVSTSHEENSKRTFLA
jgi:hypothetical protein